MEGPDSFSAEGVRRLYDVMQRVNSSTDLDGVLQEVANGVVEGLGYGVAAISVLEGETLVMTAVAGPDDVRDAILGRRTPMADVFEEYSHADEWGILRFVPHTRLDETTPYAWLPDFEPDDDDPDAWHPMDTLYAPLRSAEGRLLGNMSVDLPPGNRIPSRQQRELLEMYVVQAGIAIANAQQRARLADQVRLGRALSDVAAAASLGNLETALAEVTPRLHEAFNASQVTLRFFPEAGGHTDELIAGHPEPPRSKSRIGDLRSDLARLVAGPRPGPLLLEHEQEGGDWDRLPQSADNLRAILDDRGWYRMVLAPIGVGQELLGHIVVMRTADQPAFDAAELEAVRQASRELGRLVRDARMRATERRLLSELRELDRYKGELIATISHELKTPLTSIIGHTELLEDLDAPAVPARSVDAIRRNADRLDRLITELLSYSRMQDLREITRHPVDLVELARASLDLVAVPARTGGVEVALEADGPVVVEADPEELPRVVDNICGNAVKYTRPGGRVTVAVRERDGFGEVAVTDTGIGISAGDQAHLFSAFHRSTNPDALTIPGTGLGLAIARRIAELHGGEIVVDSELGRGSTFTLRVPIAGPAQL